MNGVQVHGDWTPSVVAPKPLVVGSPHEVGVPWVKDIIQGLCILHSLIQVLWIRDQEFRLNFWF